MNITKHNEQRLIPSSFVDDFELTQVCVKNIYIGAQFFYMIFDIKSFGIGIFYTMVSCTLSKKRNVSDYGIRIQYIKSVFVCILFIYTDTYLSRIEKQCKYTYLLFFFIVLSTCHINCAAADKISFFFFFLHCTNLDN